MLNTGAKKAGITNKKFMPKKVFWDSEKEEFLKSNFALTNLELSKILGCDSTTIKAKFKALGIDRPAGKNELSKARYAIYREKLRGKVPEEFFTLPSTRQDAKNLKTTFYWTGTPCERAGHISKRKTSSGGCWDCDYGDHKLKLKADVEFGERRKLLARENYQENKVEQLAKQREYRKNSHMKEWLRLYEKNKRQTNLSWRIEKSLRDRLYKAVTRESKLMSAVKLVGCNIEELKKYLEEKFTDGMTWENYGEWHIDHIRPCASFNLFEADEQRECFHFTNLQPLWSYDNKSKGGIWGGIDPRGKKTKKAS